jgi:hypothetical protein
MAAMALRLAADLKVDAFGVTVDEETKRLDFTRAEADELKGSSGRLQYGVHELVLDHLYTLLDRMHWAADAGSAGQLWLRTEDGALEMTLDRVELPRGVIIARAAAGGIEIRAPNALHSDVKIVIPDLAALRGAPVEADAGDYAAGPTPDAAAKQAQRRAALQFLDALTGEVSFTVRVQLDLPVLGVRTLEQSLRIPIKDGSIDFRALEKGLDWLEGAFLAIRLDGRRLAVSWGVPIIAPAAKDIVYWDLDDEAMAIAPFGRVPLRSLIDAKLPGDGRPKRNERKRSVLRSLTIGNIQASLSLLAPRSLEVAGGTILLGGDDAPGIVDLELSGVLTHPPKAGGLQGTIGVLDATLKDIHFGSVGLTIDRLHVGAVETIGVMFDGFRPVGVVATINRVSATNVSLFIGGERPPDDGRD